jgi:hypothetical protein
MKGDAGKIAALLGDAALSAQRATLCLRVDYVNQDALASILMRRGIALSSAMIQCALIGRSGR